MDAPRLRRAISPGREAECKAFAEAYRGKLAELAGSATMRGAALAEAVARYEALEDLLGRIMSYAGLVYAGDTSRPEARQVLRRHRRSS